MRRAEKGDLEAWLTRFLPLMFSSAPGQFHRGMYDDLSSFVAREPIDGAVRNTGAYAYPRGHGKTTTMVGFALWCVFEWREMAHFGGKPPFILIVSDTVDQARDRALDIRDQIEGNEALIDRYGQLAPTVAEREGRDKRSDGRTKKRLKWTETDFTTRTGVRIKAVGSNSKIRGLLRGGQRPTLVLCDDLENDEHVETSRQRQKLERWLRKALIPVGQVDKCLYLVFGTILHVSSLLSRLLSKEHFPGWLKRRFAALYNAAGMPDAGGDVALWPQFWTIAKLLTRRGEIGTVAFSQEYLNQAIDDATTLFRLAWLQRAMDRGKGRPFLYGPSGRIPWHVALATWDPAELAEMAEPGAMQLQVTAWDLGLVADERRAKEQDSDYTAGVTVTLDPYDRLIVMRVFRRRGMTPNETRGAIAGSYQVLDDNYVAIENVQAQSVYEIDLRNAGIPIKGHRTDRRKHSVYEGVPGMALLFENDRIDLCWDSPQEREKIEILRDELYGLGREAHDDTVMALWFAVSLIRRWIKLRDRERLRLIGPPPGSYRSPFPVREDRHTRREAA